MKPNVRIESDRLQYGGKIFLGEVRIHTFPISDGQSICVSNEDYCLLGCDLV